MCQVIPVLVLLSLCGLFVNVQTSSPNVVQPIHITTKVEEYHEKFNFSKQLLNSSSPLILRFGPITNVSSVLSIYIDSTNTVLKDEKVSFKNVNGYITATLENPSENYFGKIILMVSTNDGTQKFNYSVENYGVVPVIVRRETSKRIVQGNTAEFFCEVVGVKNPKIIWTRLSAEYNLVPVGGNRTNFTMNRFPNDTLVLTSVDYNDAGPYICFASEGNNTDTALIELRVKDRLAALWPFIGIVIEVIILVVAILFYENKRSKQAQANRAAEQQKEVDGDRAAVRPEDHGEKDGETRQRSQKA